MTLLSFRCRTCPSARALAGQPRWLRPPKLACYVNAIRRTCQLLYRCQRGAAERSRAQVSLLPANGFRSTMRSRRTGLWPAGPPRRFQSTGHACRAWLVDAESEQAMVNRSYSAGPIAAFIVGALLLGQAQALQSVLAGGYNPCEKPGNLTVNCGFDSFGAQTHNGKPLQVPTGWTYFILDGDLEYRTSTDTYWGAPSLWLVSDGVLFTAGIYQQVAVKPGAVYQADAGWAAPDKPDFERRLGLDPTGGTNPQAPSVVWGPSAWDLKPAWPDLTVTARATGPTMTVFVWVRHATSHGADSVFIDAVGLWPDPNQPAATNTPVPSPVPTRRPATRTPVPVVPTAAPTIPPPSPTVTEPPTPLPTETPAPPPTATPTETPTPLPPTPTPTATPTASVTSLPVIVPARSDSTGAPARSSSPAQRSKPLAGALQYVAGGALLGAVLLAAAAIWLLARSRRQDDSPPDEH